MSQSTTLKVLVKGNHDIVDATMSQADGGNKLKVGLREAISSKFPGVAIDVSIEPSQGLAATRQEISAGTTRAIDSDVDIVILSVAEDARTLPDRAPSRDEALHRVLDDITAVVDGIKTSSGAHILIANVSTVDPSDETFDFSGLAVEPLSLRAQRLDLMLVEVSHRLGISVIDVDRLIAEIGAAEHVESAFSYSALACSKIVDEIVRVLEDYGFFDDRPLMEQVGAGSK